MSLTATLRALEPLARGKRKPATKADLGAIEAIVGKVPADLRTLYGWGRNVDALFAEANLVWLDPKEGVAACKLTREFDLPDGLFPIATDEAGNYACFDVNTGRVMDWDHETRRATRLAKDLAAYLDKTVVSDLVKKRRDADAKARRVETEAKTGGAHRLPGALPAEPKKIEPIRNVLRTGAYVFVSDDEVISVGPTTNFDNLGDQKRRSAQVQSMGAAFDRERNQAVLVNFDEMSLVDVESAKLLSRFTAPIKHWATVVLSPDCSLACTHSTSGAIQLWDLRARHGIPALGGATAYTSSFDLPKGAPLATLSGHEDWVRRARFDASGSSLASCDKNGVVCLWDVPSRSLRFSKKVKGEAHTVDFSPDGGTLYVGCESGKVVVFDRSGKQGRTLGFRGQVSDLRVLSNDLLVVLLQVTVGGAYATVAAVAKAKDGKVLAQSAPMKKVTMARVTDVRGDLVVVSSGASSNLFRVT